MHSQLPTHQILLEKSMEQVPLRGLTILFKKGWHIPHTTGDTGLKTNLTGSLH